jgi:hypothetical protein
MKAQFIFNVGQIFCSLLAYTQTLLRIPKETNNLLNFEQAKCVRVWRTKDPHFTQFFEIMLSIDAFNSAMRSVSFVLTAMAFSENAG